jgi:hypothetical protein
VLKGNNDNISNLRYFSGTYATIIDTTGDQNEIYNNGLAFNMKVGKPYGYNGINGILLPQQIGGFIRATLSGSADFTTEISSIANLVATLEGEGSIDPQINAAYNMVIALLGEGNITPALKALANMSATLDAGARPSAFDIAQEVWQARASSYNASGSMGQQINNVGAGANPWTAPIDGDITAEEALKIILSVLAGKTTITKGTGNTAVVKFRNIGDTKDRLSVNMEGSERKTIALNTD